MEVWSWPSLPIDWTYAIVHAFYEKFVFWECEGMENTSPYPYAMSDRYLLYIFEHVRSLFKFNIICLLQVSLEKIRFNTVEPAADTPNSISLIFKVSKINHNINDRN